MINITENQKTYSSLITSLKTILSLYCSEHCCGNMDNPNTIIQILKNSLRDFAFKVKTQEEKLNQVEREAQEAQVFAVARHNVLIEEHKNRLQKFINDYELQLSTAEERSMNSRRQATILQIQLNKALSQVQHLEVQLEKQVNELTEKNCGLVAMISNLQEKLYLKDMELKEHKEMVSASQDKNKREIFLEKNYLDELQIELAKEKACVLTLQVDLEQERERNQHLWTETSGQIQEIAILKSQLDSAQAEITHRDHLFENLRQEMLLNIRNFLPFPAKASDFSDGTSIIQMPAKSKEILEITHDLDENRLKSKKIRLKSIKEELDCIDNKISQISVQLKVKKELLKKLTVDLKNITKSVASCVEKCNEKKEYLETLKTDEKKKDEAAMEIMNRARDIRRKTMLVVSHIKYAEEETNHLSETFEQIKHREENLYEKCLLKQSHLDQLTKLLLSKVKLIKDLEREISDSNAMTMELICKYMNTQQSPDICQPLTAPFKGIINRISKPSIARQEASSNTQSNQDLKAREQQTPTQNVPETMSATAVVDSSLILNSQKIIPNCCDKITNMNQHANFQLKQTSLEAKKPGKKSRRRLSFMSGFEASPIYINSPARITLKSTHGMSRKLIINQPGTTGPLTIDLNVEPPTVNEEKRNIYSNCSCPFEKDDPLGESSPTQRCSPNSKLNDDGVQSKESPLNHYLSSGSSGFFSVHDDFQS